jgi:hypothetical protein
MRRVDIVCVTPTSETEFGPKRWRDHAIRTYPGRGWKMQPASAKSPPPRSTVIRTGRVSPMAPSFSSKARAASGVSQTARIVSPQPCAR